MKFYYAYVLRSLVDNNLYIGYIDDLIARVARHKAGLVNSIKPRQPLELVYY